MIERGSLDVREPRQPHPAGMLVEQLPVAATKARGSSSRRHRARVQTVIDPLALGRAVRGGCCCRPRPRAPRSTGAPAGRFVGRDLLVCAVGGKAAGPTPVHHRAEQRLRRAGKSFRRCAPSGSDRRLTSPIRRTGRARHTAAARHAPPPATRAARSTSETHIARCGAARRARRPAPSAPLNSPTASRPLDALRSARRALAAAARAAARRLRERGKERVALRAVDEPALRRDRTSATSAWWAG